MTKANRQKRLKIRKKRQKETTLRGYCCWYHAKIAKAAKEAKHD